MNAFLTRLGKWLEQISWIMLFLGIAGVILMFGSFFLNLFGVISYDPPLNQDASNVAYIELIDSGNPSGMETAATLTGAEMEAFLEAFQKLRFKRYANDPPSPYGDFLVAIYYKDGSVDRIGEIMNTYQNASGESLPAGGWYYCPGNEMEMLFDRYSR